MFINENPTKEELIAAIEKIENSSNDVLGIVTDVGVTALGAAGAATAAVTFGTTTISIPIITALTGVGLFVAAPIALVTGAAVAGGAVVYGVSRFIKDSSFHEGKRNQILNEIREKLKEVKAQERRESNQNQDANKSFYSSLKEALKHNLISSEDAYRLIRCIEKGSMPLSEAYENVCGILSNR